MHGVQPQPQSRQQPGSHGHENKQSITNGLAAKAASPTYVQFQREVARQHLRAWQEKYSRKLVDGWYVDTNLNTERMSRILPAVTRAAGLVWGEDVKVYWKATAVAQ